MTARDLPPGILIAAPASGTGKTTLTLGLARAFRDRGLGVQCFKAGPDYIDPAFHAVASGRAAFNLDSWAMGPAMLDGLVRRSAGADLTIAEGAMGLFDGVAARGATGTGASADIAARTGWPVVLVIDPAGQAQTAAAVAAGLAGFRRDVTVAGVILNRVASPRHEALVRAGMLSAGIPVFGAIPRDKAIGLPERHLGLVQAEEQSGLEAMLANLAKIVSQHIDMDAIISAARSPGPAASLVSVRPPGQRIALARDAAFSFVYPHLVEGWRASGAEILPFSPLADAAPDPSADVVWLPGGYPELHAGTLAAATRFRDGLRAFAATRPVHGECGGYMVLGRGIVAADGARHEMTGLLGLETSFALRKLHLGYRLAELVAPIPGAGAGTRLRGHEFHYASVLAAPDPPLARVTDATGAVVAETGSRRGPVTGSFFHMIAEAA